MKKIKNKHNREESVSYWMSVSDLMSGVLIVFMLLFIYKLFDYSESISASEKAIESLKSTRDEIVTLMQSEFKNQNIDVNIDSNTGTLTLFEGILFDFSKSDLKEEGKKYLQQFMPSYLNILLDNDNLKNNISQIVVEGHTDTNSTYIYNLKLSQERAFSVIAFLLSDEFKYDNKEKLQKYLTANGRSFCDPVLNADGSVNEEKSRRVEIKFRLNEEEKLFN